MNSGSRSDWQDLPSIVSESLIRRFVYWDQQPQVGMHYGIELYTRLKSYPINQRLRAYDAAHSCADKNLNTCITVSSTEYTVWLSLRSLSANPEAVKDLEIYTG
ncbi:hypothetical protein [Leptolyngbya ohadii]|uniref:hypothetical protein n=1 Tax=Leptolyngbya ohadii TaxID=1962290 RepID=UPI000B59FE32|nr:hypothetical protein [Leptolyngbya ohadii]